MKFPLVALILIKVITFIYDLPILHIVVKGISGSNLGVNEEEATIRTILPLKTSLLEAILFLSPPVHRHGLHVL
jgi:hypothetical protein